MLSINLSTVCTQAAPLHLPFMVLLLLEPPPPPCSSLSSSTIDCELYLSRSLYYSVCSVLRSLVLLANLERNTSISMWELRYFSIFNMWFLTWPTIHKIKARAYQITSMFWFHLIFWPLSIFGRMTVSHLQYRSNLCEQHVCRCCLADESCSPFRLAHAVFKVTQVWWISRLIQRLNNSFLPLNWYCITLQPSLVTQDARSCVREDGAIFTAFLLIKMRICNLHTCDYVTYLCGDLSETKACSGIKMLCLRWWLVSFALHWLPR